MTAGVVTGATRTQEAEPYWQAKPVEEEVQQHETDLVHTMDTTVPGPEFGTTQPATQMAGLKGSPTKAATAKRKRVSRRAAAGTAGAGTAAGTNGHPGPNQRVVSITLPVETYNWLEDRARQAPYEPTLAKYLQWELRELEKRQRAAEGKVTGVVGSAVKPVTELPAAENFPVDSASRQA